MKFGGVNCFLVIVLLQLLRLGHELARSDLSVDLRNDAHCLLVSRCVLTRLSGSLLVSAVHSHGFGEGTYTR